MAYSIEERAIQEKEFERFAYVYMRLLEKYADQIGIKRNACCLNLNTDDEAAKAS